MNAGLLGLVLVLAGKGPADASASPPVHVDADEVQYHYKEHRIIFIGRPLVKLTREDATLTCRRLVAENDEQGQIQRATCNGDVRLTRGERVATCRIATYENAAGRVVCRGDPVLHDGPSVMRGNELTYHLDEDTVVMSQAKGTVIQRPGQEPLFRRPRAREVVR